MQALPLLTDYPWRIAYGAGDDRLHEFYIPALERSVRLDRATGFFSSAALAIAAAGIVRLIANGGTMRLLCGARLSREDVEAIRRGAELKDVVGQAMAGSLMDPTDRSMRARLEALAWLVANDRLEIKVVLPRGPDGMPIPGDIAREYYHPKEGIFVDAAGNRLAFSGSINDSESGWQHNYETFSVYTSWPRQDGDHTIITLPYLRQVEERFLRLWEGKEPNWIALEVPEAARRKLISYAPDSPPLVDPLECIPKPPKQPAAVPDQHERIIFEFLRLAPFLPNASRLGIETATVRPWPHQRRVVQEVVDRYPESFLFCDEVGLGKTIEAGLALRQLVVAGQVKRALLLVPKTVLRQWQEELYEKFVLNIPRYDGGRLLDVFDREIPYEGRVWDAVPFILASSQLAKRRERQEELLHPDAKRWDLIIVDEAHHARRKEFHTGQFRPNRLFELLAGSAGRPGLKDRTRCLYLLTATPMQVHPVEVWDLLRLLGLGGRWGADEEKFVGYFRELRKLQDGGRPDWNFLLDMFRDYLDMGGEIDERFAEAAAERAGRVEWEAIRHLPFSHNREAQIAQLSPAGQAVLVELLRRHTPLRRFVWRNTRELLRRYRERGILKENVPRRAPVNKWIPLSEGPGSERELYDRVEEYISEFYERYEAERRGLGFVMTVYRRRLTSSFYALRRSLERRRAFLQGRALAAEILTDDDLEDADLDLDFGEELDERGRTPRFREELKYIDDFIAAIDRLGTDSKLAYLLDEVAEVFTRRETLLIFTQYTDTMDYLRDHLVQVYGPQVACYSGRGGEVWDGTAWMPCPKEELKEKFRRGDRIRILLCTEAASEGLNLQTCGVLINYDMPWNPMRVEQRIGRIDRIGQRYDEVWISNYFYKDTVEALVYQRLSDRINWFESVVGELQPILHRVASSIEKLAMMHPDERRRRLEQEIAELRTLADRTDTECFDISEFLEQDIIGADEAPPLTLQELERTLVESSTLGRAFRPHGQIAGAHWLTWNGDERAVTFCPDVFDQHPSSVELLSFGSGLLTDLLDAVPRPKTGPNGTGILLRRADTPAPLAWFAHRGPEGVQAIQTLTHLQTALTTSSSNWTEADIAVADLQFEVARAAAANRYERVEKERWRAEMLALQEAARRILIYTALIDARRAEQLTLGETNVTPLFGTDAVSALADKGVPYRALLTVVLAGETPSAERDDPFYASLEGKSNAALAQRREHLRREGIELLQRWRALQALDPVRLMRTEWTSVEWFPVDPHVRSTSK